GFGDRLRGKRGRIRQSLQATNLSKSTRDSVVAYDPPVPAGVDQLVAGDGSADVADENDQHLHDPRLDSLVALPTADPAGGRKDQQLSQLEVRLLGQVYTGGGVGRRVRHAETPRPDGLGTPSAPHAGRGSLLRPLRLSSPPCRKQHAEI